MNGTLSHRDTQAAPLPYVVALPRRFIWQTLLGSILFAFAVGRTARFLLIDLPHASRLEDQGGQLTALGQNVLSHLPTPVLTGGRQVPQTTYTSKTFDTARSSSLDSRWVSSEAASCDAAQHVNQSLMLSHDDDEADEEQEYAPAGQHLLLDFQNIDGDFLNSEKRLAHAMLELVNACGLTLLSYHCHKLEPTGVSCVGVLLESHVSFHTWPEHGVIALDLYTCGPNSLLPVVPLAQKLFSVPSNGKEPRLRWAHKLRGFPSKDYNEHDLISMDDLFYFPIGLMVDYKEEIAAVESDFQNIIVYDVLTPQRGTPESYAKSLSGDGSYESKHPELFEPDRIVFMDGTLQSRRTGDAAYHEALVHPALLAHDNPKRVAIIGGGEGATLREVLKHKTLEKVVMIELDEMMVNASREFLPEWSDCSNLVGRADDCFEDSRADLYCEDAFKWFKDRFLNADEISEEPFDVIIMDALDPQGLLDIVEALYTDRDFYVSLFNGLSKDGILISQVGETLSLDDPAEELSSDRYRAGFVTGLIDIGFQSIREYNEAGCGFGFPWAFILAFKQRELEANWFANEAIVNTKIQQRIVPTPSGESSLKYFDGTTMVTYRYPPRTSEVVFCRRVTMPESCKSKHTDPENGDDPVKRVESKLPIRIDALAQSAIRASTTKKHLFEPFYHGYDRPSGNENIFNPVEDRKTWFDRDVVDHRKA